MSKYKTLVEGMTGTGQPNNTDAESAVDSQSQDVPQNGNTFDGMIVDENIKQQIEAGSASHFLECHKRDDNQYDLLPTLPETGCEGPNGTIYKLRENHNRLMKGIARKFVNGEGKIDPEAGKKFMTEFSDRFGTGEGVPKSDIYNNPYGNNIGDGFDKFANTREAPGNMKNDFNANVQWLCNELEIPEQERKDFGNFCKGNMGPGQGVQNTGKVWSNSFFAGVFMGYADKFEIANKMNEDIKLYEQKQQNPNIQNPVTIEKYQELKDNHKALTNELASTGNRLIKLAEMDPKDHKLMQIVDCDINSRLIVSYMAQAQQADLKRDDKSKIDHLEKYKLNFSSKHDKQNGQIVKPKWTDHFAPVIGKIEQNGKTYDLTLETIATPPNKLAKEPPISKPSIGLYKNQADAQATYSKNVYMTEAEQKLGDQLVSFSNDKRAFNPPANDIPQNVKWELQKEYTKQANQFQGEPTNKYLEKAQPFLQPARNTNSFIPEYLKDKYEEISAAFSSAYQKNKQIEKCYQINKNMETPDLASREQKARAKEYKQQITEDIKNRRKDSAKELSGMTTAMRYIVGDIKPKRLADEMKEDSRTPQSSTTITGFLKTHGMKVEDLNTFRKVVKNREAMETGNQWIKEGKAIINANSNQETKKMGLANLIAAQMCIEDGILKNPNIRDNMSVSSKTMTDSMAKQSDKIIKSTAFKTLLDSHHGDIKSLSNISPHLIATEYVNIRRLEKVRNNQLQQPQQQPRPAEWNHDRNRIMGE